MAGFYLAFTNMPLAAVKIKFSIFSELLMMLLHGCNTGLYRVKVSERKFQTQGLMLFSN